MSEKTGRTIYAEVDRDVLDGKLSEVVSALLRVQMEHEGDPQARLEVDWEEKEVHVVRAETTADVAARRERDAEERRQRLEQQERYDRETLARLKAKYEPRGCADAGADLAVGRATSPTEK